MKSDKEVNVAREAVCNEVVSNAFIWAMASLTEDTPDRSTPCIWFIISPDPPGRHTYRYEDNWPPIVFPRLAENDVDEDIDTVKKSHPK